MFQGTEPIFEKRISDSRIRSYVYAGTHLIARVDGVIGDTNAKKYWYHTDHLGSVKVVTNEAGKPVWNADYLPFGQQYMKNKLDSTFEEDDLGFTGKGYDADIGLYYFNARWYDTETGRFISEDPMGDPNNPNLYTYCANNPLNVTDPTGLYTQYGGTTTAGDSVADCPGTYSELMNEDKHGNSGVLGKLINNGLNALKNALNKIGKMFSGDNSKTSATNVPGVTHTSSTAKTIDGSIIQTDKYTYTDPTTKKEGKSVTIITKTTGDTIEQSYTVTENGNVINSEEITYEEGTKGDNQRNVVAVEDFVPGANKYKAIFVVVGKKGVVGAWQGSTLPNNTSTFATIKTGVYKMQKAWHTGSVPSTTGWAVSLQTLDGSYQIPTEGPNTAQNNQNFAIGIMIHNGYTSDAGDANGYKSNGSEGCQTSEPSGWNSFYDAIGGNSASQYDILGNYYLNR